MNTPRIGQIVECHSNHPHLPPGGEVVRGTVTDCSSPAWLRNPTVMTPQGGVELLARWWADGTVKVVG